MIYFPDLDNYSCFIVLDNNTIRAYEDIPTSNNLVDYRDYFVNSHYLFKDGIESFADNSVNCLSSDVITSNFYYRNDFDSICVIFMTCFFFIYFIPFILFKKFFGRLK